MKLDTRISLIVPTLGKFKIKEFVDLIIDLAYWDLNQFDKYEIIIVFNTISKCEMYHKIKEIFEDISEIRILHQPLKGICHALNEGIKKANYNYICRQDDDDISLPLRIYETYQYLVENKLDVAFCRQCIYTK